MLISDNLISGTVSYTIGENPALYIPVISRGHFPIRRLRWRYPSLNAEYLPSENGSYSPPLCTTITIVVQMYEHFRSFPNFLTTIFFVSITRLRKFAELWAIHSALISGRSHSERIPSTHLRLAGIIVPPILFGNDTAHGVRV